MSVCYEIQVRGQLSPRWSAWLGGMELASLPNGDTLIRGEVRDQPALFGLLARVRDLGLTLVLLQRVGAEAGKAEG